MKNDEKLMNFDQKMNQIAIYSSGLHKRSSFTIDTKACLEIEHKWENILKKMIATYASMMPSLNFVIFTHP